MKENIASVILWHEQTFPDATLDGQLQTNRKRKWNKIGNKFQHIEEGE